MSPHDLSMHARPCEWPRCDYCARQDAADAWAAFEDAARRLLRPLADFLNDNAEAMSNLLAAVKRSGRPKPPWQQPVGQQRRRFKR